MPAEMVINLTGMDLFEQEVLALKKTSDKQLRLLVMAEQTLRNIGNNLPLESDLRMIAINAAFNIKRELSDAPLGSENG